MARQFGATWWGRAWIDALEMGALADPARLSRGRTYARQGRVRDIEVEPGLIKARVDGTEIYGSQLGVRELTSAAWDELIDLTVSRAAYSAALLSGEVPHGLGEQLLPRQGDLSTECSCPDWGDPCKHVAALCYLIADMFDADPFAIMLVRGRGRDEVLGEIRSRRAAALGMDVSVGSDLPRGADPGMSATDAYREEAVPLDRAVTLTRESGTLLRLSTAPPADSGVDEDELRELVADAARRAHALLSGSGNSGLGLSASADVVRRAVAGDVKRISAATKLPVGDLQAAAQAWRYGGADGLKASRHRWDPAPEQLQPGVDAFTDRLKVQGGAKARGNAVSFGSIQLRLDEQGTWWRFEADDQLGWLLTAAGATDPTELLI